MRARSNLRRALQASAQQQRTPVSDSLYSLRVPGAGRALFAARRAAAGDTVLTEAEPLAWCAPAGALGSACEQCLGPLPPTATLSPSGSARYCSASCQAAHWGAGGHGLLDGGMGALNAWCAREGMNFPRLAAYALARSLSGERDFDAYWRAVHGLAYATPPPLAEHPRAFREGYSLVKGAVLGAGKVGGAGVATLFELVFTPATYARLMGTLRLNSFSVPCPLLPPGAAPPAPVPAPPPALPPPPPPQQQQADDAGCCSGEAACDDSAAGSSCGESAAAFGDAPGGTALYALASLANHACEPSADVVMAVGGSLALRARRELAAGEEVTITYLDSSLPGAVRRNRLLRGYGFECKCQRCAQGL